MCSVPVMALFGIENSHTSFRLCEVARCDTLGKVMEKYGPDDWGDEATNIVVKVSHSKSSSFDQFHLNNSVDLVLMVLKTDVLWMKFEKVLPPPTKMPTRNAFEVLCSAQAHKFLPEKLSDPFNQKLSLFNTVVDKFRELKVGFSVDECAPRLRNKKTGAATELAYDVADILWRLKMSEIPLKNRSLWSKIPEEIGSLIKVEKKAHHDRVGVTQSSSQNFAVHIREVADRALFSQQNLSSFKLALLGVADIFADLADVLKIEAEKVKTRGENLMKVSTAAEAVAKQIGEREKVSLLEKGSALMTHSLVIKIVKMMDKNYNKPTNISVFLPTNRFSRSTFLHRTLPRQIPKRTVLWSFDNGRNAPQSIFAYTVVEDETQQQIFDKIAGLRPELLSLQKFYFPREFYHQFYDQAGSVTGISKQNFKLLSAMVMGDSRKMAGDVQERFEEAMMSGDPDFVFDLRFFNGREIQFQEFLAEFRAAVEEFMVEDRGRHEKKYDVTIISKVSFGFSLKSVFEEVCRKVQSKNPNCPIPKSESFLSRYLIPRTRAAAESASVSQPLIPLKLAMQQKVIEKPNVDAYYNAAFYKYLRSFAVELGSDKVTMIGWDDKTGVDIGEPEQPTAATQNPGKSWVHTGKSVGEGQHSFHKTNITPSVRLVHEIPEDMNGSFFRGDPQVSIKDAIFEHSTSARHATELMQMFQVKPELLKPVLILTNDGGVDHTIRHSRNVVAMLAIFLHFPQILMLTNFQMAAYRSAYHPVEKLNCVLNLSWNGICLSREVLKDPVLEKAFAGCSSMEDARKLAIKHPGLKKAVKNSIQPSINILEERAKQGSLKGNYFETFNAASEEDIQKFLAIVQSVDPEFDVGEFQDKKKPYNYSPTIKSYIDEHVTTTHYAITFKRHKEMSAEFLSEVCPQVSWSVPLEPVSCPVLEDKKSEKFVTYDDLKMLHVKDYEDTCRPGKHFKTPANIPFPKNKQRALYGCQVEVVCDSCGKRRVVYLKFKPSGADISAAKFALRNTRYVCGGRLSSFGRSLAVMEEISDVHKGITVIDDEIDNESIEEEEAPAAAVEITSTVDEMEVDDIVMFNEKDDWQPAAFLTDYVEDEMVDSKSEEPAPKKSKKFVIYSSSDSEDESNQVPPQLHDGHHFMSSLQSLQGSSEGKGPCSFCVKVSETGHTCKVCSKRCCNLCNKVEVVEELSDILCPDCFKSDEDDDKVNKRMRGRGRSVVKTGKILIPLQRKGRGRPRKEISSQESTVKRGRGRPKKDVSQVEGTNDDLNEGSSVHVDGNHNDAPSEEILTELRIIGSENILSKIFVSEAMTCDDSIEPHLYDILESEGRPLPCFYCGEEDHRKLFSVMTEEDFPLCKACHNLGRGAGTRRKSRVIKPKPVKPKKITMKKKKPLKRRNLID